MQIHLFNGHLSFILRLFVRNFHQPLCDDRDRRPQIGGKSGGSPANTVQSKHWRGKGNMVQMQSSTIIVHSPIQAWSAQKISRRRRFHQMSAIMNIGRNTNNKQYSRYKHPLPLLSVPRILAIINNNSGTTQFGMEYMYTKKSVAKHVEKRHHNNQSHYEITRLVSNPHYCWYSGLNARASL